MAMVDEFRCFVGGLSWETTERSLMNAFETYGVVDAKVVSDRETGRSRGFGFVTFGNKAAMDDAIDGMNGKELDGRTITVNVAQPRGASGGGGRSYGGGGGYGSGGGGGGYSGGSGGGGECFKCGETGHWARDCPSGGGGGGSYRGNSRGGGGDRYSGGYGGGGGGSRGYGGGGDRYSSGSSDRYSSRSSGGGPSRYDGSGYRDRSGPYDRSSGGGSSRGGPGDY